MSRRATGQTVDVAGEAKTCSVVTPDANRARSYLDDHELLSLCEDIVGYMAGQEGKRP